MCVFNLSEAATNPFNFCIRLIKISILYLFPVVSTGLFICFSWRGYSSPCKSSALTTSFNVWQPPNAPFVLSCPIRSFRKLNSRDRKNLTPETQCLALFQKKFVLWTCRLILRFPQIFTFGGGWGNSFSLYLSYDIYITLSINLLRNYWAFPDSP